MKANVRSMKTLGRDDGVSPVIAVILMVAITVVLAATVYVWVSGFASEDSGPEQASATARGFSTTGSDTNWIRVTLVKGENAPYGEKQANYTLLDPNGESYSADDSSATNYLCTDAKVTTGSCTNAFHDGTGTDANTWDVGEVLYIPCQDSGDHSVTITVRGSTILDSAVNCDVAAT